MVNPEDRKRQSLLIIEDDDNLRELIIKDISRSGYEAAGCSSGSEALRHITASPPSAIIIDQALPDMSGRDLLLALDKIGLVLPFIVITGQGDERLAVEMMKLGATDYLIKDINFLDILAVAVERLFKTIKKEQDLQDAEERLKKSEANYAAIISGITDIVWRYEVDEEGTLVESFISPVVDQLLGLPAGTIGSDFEKYICHIHHDDLPKVLGRMTEALALQRQDAYGQYKVASDDYRLCTADDKLLWVRTQGRAQLQENGKVTIYGTTSDITRQKQAEEELIAVKQFNEDIVQNINEGIVISASDGKIQFANQALQKILGYEAGELIGLHWKTIVIPAEHHLVEEANIRRSNGSTDRYELMLKHKDGSIIPVQISGSPYHDSKSGKLIGTLAVLTNITERKTAEEAVFESEQRYREILETTEEGFYEVDLKGKIIACNRAAAKMLGFQEEELVGLSYVGLCKDSAAVYREFNQAFTTGKPKFSVIMEMIRKDGTISTADLSVSLTYDKQGNITGFRGMGRDISERIKLEDHLKYLSFRDQLTGLYNRRYFENELKRLNVSRDYPVAVISADLDGLKLINDILGHSEGDRYLQAGADLLKSALRASDILARVGGDEFALLLPCTNKREADLLMNRIRRQVESYNYEQKNLPLSISLGLAISENPDYSLEEVFRMADNNMYSDKLEQGKKARAEIVSSLLSSLFKRDNLAEGVRAQVQELSVRLGLVLKLEESRMAALELLTQVYDLGKVALPDNLLHQSMLVNQGELTEAEREAICRHPETGYRIALTSPALAGVAELILRHHENYDGSGYPLGIKGEEIPVECRILAIAIAYSAMTNSRPYAETLTHEEVLTELERCAGSQFDPQLVKVFIAMISEGL